MCKSITKRVFLMVMVAWITFISVFGAYQETTYCAEWIAGTIATIGGAPLLTALCIGGVVVAGGIAIYELSQTDHQDYVDFYNGVKNGFTEFVAEQETIIAKEQDSSLSDQEASDIGVAVARNTVNEFLSNTVENVSTTTKSVKEKALAYWQLYSKIMGDVADNGISSNSGITVGDKLKVWKCSDFSLLPDSELVECKGTFNEYNETSTFDNITYISKGRVVYENLSSYKTIDTTIWNFNNASINNCIPFLFAIENNNYLEVRVCGLNLNKINTWDRDFKNGSVILGSSDMYLLMKNDRAGYDVIKNVLASSSLPVIFGKFNDADRKQIFDNWRTWLSVSGGSWITPNYKRTINNALENTHIGKSIQTGRRTLVNNGTDDIQGVFELDSYPIKRSSVKDSTTAGVYSGDLGWDIPLPATWDGYFSDDITFPRVIGETGTLTIPKDDVIGYTDDDTVIDFPDDTVVDDPADTETDPADNPTIKDVIDDQGGTFYPTALDLTNIFPFCIPFDIIYLVNQYSNVEESAPVINYEIVYPQALQSSLGESYTVTIDFADFISVRNVLRVFILLLFVVGLMKITRDLIRG